MIKSIFLVTDFAVDRERLKRLFICNEMIKGQEQLSTEDTDWPGNTGTNPSSRYAK